MTRIEPLQNSKIESGQAINYSIYIHEAPSTNINTGFGNMCLGYLCGDNINPNITITDPDNSTTISTDKDNCAENFSLNFIALDNDVVESCFYFYTDDLGNIKQSNTNIPNCNNLSIKANFCGFNTLTVCALDDWQNKGCDSIRFRTLQVASASTGSGLTQQQIFGQPEYVSPESKKTVKNFFRQLLIIVLFVMVISLLIMVIYKRKKKKQSQNLNT